METNYTADYFLCLSKNGGNTCSKGMRLCRCEGPVNTKGRSPRFSIATNKAVIWQEIRFGASVSGSLHFRHFSLSLIRLIDPLRSPWRVLLPVLCQFSRLMSGRVAGCLFLNWQTRWHPRENVNICWRGARASVCVCRESCCMGTRG